MEQSEHKLIIIEYTEYPGPRYCDQGESSGEDFYHTQLNSAFLKAIKSNYKLKVVLDGTAGYASSFLDEAFGNLVYDFTLEKIKKHLVIISEEEPDWKKMITNETFIEWEQRRLNKKPPKKTTLHKEWSRFQNNEFNSKVWIQ